MRYFQKSGFLYVLLLTITGLAANRCADDPDPKIIPFEDTSYKWDSALEFSHEIHAGKNGIDCKFCHDAALDGKTEGIPLKNVCLKCHKEVTGDTTQENGK